MKSTSLHLTIFILLLVAAPRAFAQNYFAGPGAGASNTTGLYNDFVGYQAGYFNTSSSNNSFLGYRAGFYNTTGYSNSFVGSRAGALNTTGVNNSFLGTNAGYSNTTGGFNSFLGMNAGYSNSSGLANNFLGSYSGYSNTDGHDNNFVGYAAGYGNSSGAYNSIVGNYAGFYTTSASYNSFLGYDAGFRNTTGYNNSFLGYQAGYSNSVGYSNSFLGAYTGYSNTTGTQNTFLGRGSGYSNTTGGYNTFVGNFNGVKNTTGSNNTLLGYYANFGASNLTNATAIGFQAQVNASNSLVLGSINGVNGATADTKVGIKTSAPAYNLHVNGSAAKPGGGSWTAASDQRLKQDVTDFKDGLALIEQIHPVRFRYNGKADLPTDKQYVGVIAQEMQKVAPYTIGEFIYQDSTGKQEKYLDYDANAVTYMLVNAVREVDQKYTQQLKEKDAQLASQQQQIGALTDRLLKLEAFVTAGNKATSAEDPASGAARLWQNEPNPTDGSTVIRYFIPQEATSAHLKVYSTTGEEVHSIEIKQKGNGQVQLSGQALASGVYVYRLFMNGKSVASKKLVLAK